MLVTDPCPTCGTPRPADSPAGICPLCLMRLGLDDDDPTSDDSLEDVLSSGARRMEASGVIVERLRTDVTTIEIGDIAAYAGDTWSLQGAKLAEPGRRLLILGEIARSGMGIVLLGHDTELGRDIAIKVLHDKHRDHPNMIDRFVAEARIAGQLQHPGVVPVEVAGVCDPEELAALPADECKAWRDFWHEVETRVLVDPGYPGRGTPVQATSSLYDKKLGLFPN